MIWMAKQNEWFFGDESFRIESMFIFSSSIFCLKDIFYFNL